MTGSVFLLSELSTDFKKKQIFIFKILVKPWDFVVKDYINIIHMRIVKCIFFEIIFIFLSRKRSGKRIGCAKASLI